MACGFEKISVQVTEVLPGDMKEIFIGKGSDKKKLADNAQHLWHQLVAYVKHHSAPDMQQGRAYHLFKQITGQDPTWKFTTAPQVEISKNVYNKIQQMNIAYRRGLESRK
jgi:hypothetical protein